METGTAGLNDSSTSTSGAPAQESPSFADTVGDMFGDFLPTGESSVPDAGRETPAAASGTTSPAGSEGPAADAEHADDTASAATGETSAGDPDQVVPATDTGDDALDGFTPFTYRSDNQERSVDGIRVHPEHGAIVDPEFVPQLAQRLSEADHYKAQSKAQHDRYTQLENATTWEVRNAQGQPEKVTGVAAVEAQRVVMARSLAVNQAVAGILDGTMDPKQFLAWDEASQSVVWNQDALKEFRDKTLFNADRAEWSARRAMDPYRANAPVNATAETPIAELAPATIDATAQSLGLTNLSAEDKTFLAEQLPQYVRATTEAERRQDPTIGPRVVDEKFVTLMKRVAQSRVDTATAAKTAANATQQNAARLLAAGKRPSTTTRTTAPTRQPTPQQSRVKSAEDAWDLHERAMADAMRRKVG